MDGVKTQAALRSCFKLSPGLVQRNEDTENTISDAVTQSATDESGLQVDFVADP